MKHITKQLLIVTFLFRPFLGIAQTEDFIFRSSVVDKVVAYNDIHAKLYELLKKAQANKTIDTVILKLEIMETVKKCFQIPQDYINDYPASPLCLQALKMLGTGSKNSPVQIVDLEKLFNSLATEIKNSRQAQAYVLQLKSWPWLNQLKDAARTAFIKKSLSSKLTKGALLEGVDKKASISPLSQGKSLLNEESEIVAKLKAATLIVSMVYLRPEDKILQVNPTTAYVIDEKGTCVTNYHVMKEYSDKDMYQSFSVLTAEGKAYPLIKILAASESDDLVIFQVDTKGEKLSALPLGNNAAKGTAIHVMGHPISSFYKYSSGVVTDYSTSTLAGKPCNLMNITADFNVGSSGGPIMDSYGNMVGTVSRRNNDGSMKTGIPVSELKKLIEFRK